MQKRNFVAFDVETPNSANDRICSIGLTLLSDGAVSGTQHFLINPEAPFDPFNISLTGIDADLVAGAPTFAEIWPSIQHYFTDYVVAAHNAIFDLSVLRKTLSAYHLQLPDIKYICTLNMSRKALPELGSHKLNDLCDYYGIALNHHNAESDSLACAELLRRLLASGMQVNRYLRTYNRSADGPGKQYDAAHRKGRPSTQTQALLDLKQIADAITADNDLTEAEIMFLDQWMQANQSLRGNYPFDVIYATLSGALEDGILEQHELVYLLTTLKSAFDPLQQRTTFASVDRYEVVGKNICLTGEFDRCSRSQLEKALASIGAVVQKSVTRTTDYLIVGGQGSSAWSAGNYGNKVKKALELQGKGFDIQIIRERDFLDPSKNEVSV